MNDPCQSLTAQLADGRLDDASRAHAAQCPSCRTLLAADRSVSNDLDGPATLSPSAELQALMAAPLAPTRGFSVARRLAAPALATALTVAAFAMRATRPDLGTQPRALFVGALAVMVVAWLGAGVLALGRGRAGVGVNVGAQVAGAAAALGAFTVVALAMTRPSEGSVLDDSLGGIWHCGSFSVAVGALLGAVAFGAARRTAVVSPAASGALLGVASGLGGAMVLHWICGVASPLHVLVGHGAAAALGAALGALLGRRVVAV